MEWEVGHNDQINKTILEESSRNFGLGVVHDEDRICCGGRRGCKKRYCCPGIVLTALLFDIASFGVYIYEAIQESKEGRKSYTARTTVIFFPFTFCYLIKLWYGIYWFFKGRQRKHFLPYYRIAMTANLSNMIFILPLAFIMLSLDRHREAYLAFCLLAVYGPETIILEVHIRYLDSLHFAKNEL